MTHILISYIRQLTEVSWKRLESINLNKSLYILDYECPYTGKEIIQRAGHQIDSNQYYSLLWNNCEHFAFEIKKGIGMSEQAKNAMYGAVMGVAVAGIGALVAVC